MIPTEQQEGERLATRLRIKNYKSTHIANEIGIRGKIWMLVNKKKKKQWLSRGFPDYCIILKSKKLLFIELKRQRRVLKNWKLGASPSVTSQEQTEWIECLNEVWGVQAEICYGADESIELIERLELI